MKNTNEKLIENKGYNLIGILDDEIDCLESFVNDYSGTTYLCDSITEIADSYIPIYHNHIWENVSDIQEYVEEAIAQGLVDTSGRNVDLVRIFQAGYYEYYSQALYNNLDSLCYNYIANAVNDTLNNNDDLTAESLDFESIIESIENEVADSDNNNTYDDLNEKAKRITDYIMEGKYQIS